MKTLISIFVSTSATKTRLVGFLVVAVIGLLVANIARGVVRSSAVYYLTEDALRFVDIFGATLAIPIAAMVFGTASFGDLIDDQTFVYVWARPIQRYKYTLAAYISTVGLVLVTAVVPAFLGGIWVAESAQNAGAFLAGCVAAAFGYSAVFVLLGHMSRRSLIWGIAYLLIFEQFIARGGKWLGTFSVHSHALSIMTSLTDIDPTKLSYFGASRGLLYLLITIGVSLGFSSYRQRHATVY